MHTVSELKKGAVIGDFDTLIKQVTEMYTALEDDCFDTNRCAHVT